TTFSDWDKAAADVVFLEAQKERIEELNREKLKGQNEVVERLRKTVAAGVDTLKDLRTEETNLRLYGIQAAKEAHEADTAVKVARRNEAALSRQLQQGGLDPDLLREATRDMDLVIAEVPEAKLARVQKGQSCEARFFAIPGQVFTGKVTSLLPVVSKERRTLRVLFTL